jgi:putative inorganic carbon (HCO3(-)) transporter
MQLKGMNTKLLYTGAGRDKIWILTAFILSIAFLIISMLLTDNGFSLLWLIPPSAILILLAVTAIDKFLILIVFLVPLSVQLRFLIQDPPADIFLPTEIMLFGVLIIMIFKIFNTNELNRKLLVHPVSIVCFLMLGWSFITSLTGTLPVVSLKSSVMKLWYITGFYLLAAEIFKKPARIKHYFFAYLFGMIPVVLYYLIRMWNAGIFNQKAAYSRIFPFFNDHTALGAALAFCIPLMVYFILSKETSLKLRNVFFVLLILFSAAFVFSYSRAAWLSIFVAIIFATVLILKISLRLVLASAGILVILLLFSWNTIILNMNTNKQESSGNITRHLKSATNIRSDASNVERINRWNSAIRMFRENPFIGWGPATYQFRYASFQLASEKTIISTNYGEKGNAHSEYLGSLVDSGFPGLILYLLLLFLVFWRGMKIWKGEANKKTRLLVLFLMTGLVTYVVHGFMNNFLDTDKISALFWGFIAAIVATDLRFQEETGKGTNENLQQ